MEEELLSTRTEYIEKYPGQARTFDFIPGTDELSTEMHAWASTGIDVNNPGFKLLEYDDASLDPVLFSGAIYTHM